MRGVQIGSAVGIPVRINWTFLIVLPLFAAFIAWDLAQLVDLINTVFGSTLDPEPLTEGYLPWLLGLASALGLFVGVLLHEFGHSLVAMRYGYEIDSITLWLLGGVASFDDMPADWRHELAIAIAGPIVSVLVGVVSFVGFAALSGGTDPVRFVLGYLAILNVALAAFNMLPAFPMDGGRVLRAILGRNQPHAVATQQAAAIGKWFAFLLALVGVFANWFLILVALFVYIAASGEARQTSMSAALEGVTVRDLMTEQDALVTVSVDVTVTELLGQMFDERHVGYPVVDEYGDLVGIITLEDVADVDEVERDAYTVGDLMTPDPETIGPDADAMTAFEQMQETDVGRLPVVDGRGDLVGIVSRTDLMRALTILRSTGRSDLPGDALAESG